MHNSGGFLFGWPQWNGIQFRHIILPELQFAHCLFIQINVIIPGSARVYTNVQISGHQPGEIGCTYTRGRLRRLDALNVWP